MTRVLINGTTPGEMVSDPGGDHVLVRIGRDQAWVDRRRVTIPADHLGKNERPGPANAAYRGIISPELSNRGKK